MNPRHEVQTIVALARAWRQEPDPFARLPRWLASLLPGRTPLAAGVPWTTYRAIAWLDAFLRRGMQVFEYGSGGSTLFFARHGTRVVAVEHDPDWSSTVRRLTGRFPQVTVLDRPPEAPPVAEGLPHDPRFYASHVASLKGQTFVAYARAIDAYPDASFDLVFVDGRARAACVAHALPKLRPGGALFLDDSLRPAYRPALTLLAPFRRTDLHGVAPFERHVRSASVWRLPSGEGGPAASPRDRPGAA